MAKLAKLLFILPFSLALLYLVSLSQSPANFLSSFELESADFHNFLNQYNKDYSDSEKLLRFNIYRSNLKQIHEINSKVQDFKLAPNKFADISQDEFAELYSTATTKLAVSKQRRTQEDLGVKAAPQDWDWRDKGAVSDVDDQGDCHASWAFASVGAIEGLRVAVGLQPLIDLSVQEILDCTTLAGDHGCSGGVVDDAFLFAKQYGLTTDLIYPYIGANQTCKQNSVNQNVTIINGYLDVLAQDSPRLINAVAQQPVVSHVDVSGYVWQFYYSGVINQYCGTDVHHSVLVVGYSQSANPPYFIVKNSWGQEWGESGYARIGIYGGAGICGINQLSSYPIY